MKNSKDQISSSKQSSNVNSKNYQISYVIFWILLFGFCDFFFGSCDLFFGTCYLYLVIFLIYFLA